MSRTPSLSGLLLVAALLAGLTAGVGVAVETPVSESVPGGTAGDVTSVPNTTNYAFPDPASDSRRGYIRGNVDVAGAVATAGDRLDGRHTTLSFEQQYESRNTTEARLEVVRSTIDRAEQRLADLDARQESLFRLYTNGTVSEEAFIRRLARLKVRATESTRLLDRVGSTVRADGETTLPVSVQTQLAALGGELVTLPGEVTTRLTGTVRGETDPISVYVQGAGNGIVLATVDDAEFIRQATLRSAYTPGAPNQFSRSEDEPVSVAFDRARTLYPWVSDNLRSINRIAGFGDSDVYLIDLSHPHGTVTSYIHGGSTDIFHEQHRQRPDAVPTQRAASNVNNTLELRVNATTETGPMQISVSRETTNTPADAVVRIDGTRVGTTGSDGQLWAVRPSDSVRITATAADGTSVGVSP